MNQSQWPDSKPLLGVIAKGGISAALIAWLVSQVDVDDFTARLSHLHYAWFLAAVAGLSLQVVVAAQRWVWVLRALGIALPLPDALRIVCVGLFFNQTLPTTLGGDILRVLELRRAQVTLAQATTSVVLDRISALAAILVIVVLSLPALLMLIGEPVAKLSLPVAAIGGLVGLVALAHLDLLMKFLKGWQLPAHVAVFVRNARHVLFSFSHSRRTLGSSLVIAITSGICVGLLARSLDINVDILTCCILVPPVLLLTTLPISLAGWGVREAAMVVALSYVNVNAADALLLSIAFGCIVMSVGLPGGVLWLASKSDAAISHSPVRVRSRA